MHQTEHRIVLHHPVGGVVEERVLAADSPDGGRAALRAVPCRRGDYLTLETRRPGRRSWEIIDGSGR